MRTSIITLAVCAGALLVPGMAQAATITYEGNTLVYRAAPGERNQFGLYADRLDAGSGKIEISDAYGVKVTYPGSCEEPWGAGYGVQCIAPTGGVRAELGDGDDFAAFGSDLPSAVRAEIHGGPGKDDLRGYGATNPVLDGGDGADALTGWHSNDTLIGGAGDDKLQGHAGDDVLQGGDGNDTLEPDTYDDPGDDTSASCGYWGYCTYPFGNDTIDARDGEADVVDCGVGEDTALVDAIDVVAGCENVNGAGGGGSGGGGGARGGSGWASGGAAGRAFTLKGLTLSVPCAAACKVTAVLTVDKATARKLRLGRSAKIGGGSARRKAAGTAKVKLKLARKAKRVRKATLKVTVTTAAGRQTASKAVKLGR